MKGLVLNSQDTECKMYNKAREFNKNHVLITKYIWNYFMFEENYNSTSYIFCYFGFNNIAIRILHL